ncbi:MAG: carboxypeptidase regulatory-like domain-containing protein [Patescibacteria group bacterium]
MKRGFTLVEVLVGAAVFVVIAIAAYNAYVSLFQLIELNQYKVLAINLANERFEIARNMPYAIVGVQGSIPNGSIPRTQALTRGGTTFMVTTTVRNIDLPFDGTIGGTPNDLSPADNKLVQVEISCSTCRGMQPIILVGQISPKNLETASTNGALFIQVFDANGQPVQDASVHIVNVATTTTIVIDDVTDANGMLQLVDIPPQGNAYRITVSKSGYSTDRTYPIGGSGNPNPSKPDATVLLQQVTQISFAIDKLSSIHFSTVTPTCETVSNFGFNIAGSKQIGANVPKYNLDTSTNSSGKLDINSMEWDSYVISPIDATRYLSGINPLNPVAVNPDGSQNIQLIAVPKNPSGLIATIKDYSTLLPLSGATSKLAKDGGGFEETLLTGQGYISQTDWSLGPGQESFSNQSKYFSDDGNMDTSLTSGQIKLRNAFGEYNPSGILESSTFDTGSASNFFSLVWSPIDQPILAGVNSARFQFATNATITPTTTWAFKGPDGNDTSYYLSSNSSLSSTHNGDKYARYRVYLSTQTATVTPSISDIAFTYTSDCVPPGQVIFTGLSAGNYTLEVSKAGYSTYTISVEIGTSWQESQILLSP